MKVTKQCTKCSKTKDLEDFGNFSRSPDGKKCICKSCITVMNQNRYLNKKDQIKEENKEWAAQNVEKTRIYKNNYYHRNKDGGGE